MKRFAAIGFDRGGVITNRSGINFNQQVCDITGVSLENYKTAYYNHSRELIIDNISATEMWRRVLTDLHKVQYLGEVLNLVNMPKTFDEEVIQVIKELKGKGYKVGLLSNDSKESACRMRKLEHLDELFSVMLVSGETGYAKPTKEAYIDFCNKLGISPWELLFVDDSELNLDGGVELGITTILYKNPNQLRATLKDLEIL